MKVRVVLTIDVDPDAWRAEYGDEKATLAEIREDVKLAIAQAATDQGGIYREGAGIIRKVESS